MARMTATEASRNFSDVLTRAQQGEQIEIVRNGAPVAVVGPPKRTRGITAAELQALVDELEPFDDDFAKDVAEAKRRGGLAGFFPSREDPWEKY
jgi:prevent-host-death family protein